jgi:hypothetical protein
MDKTLTSVGSKAMQRNDNEWRARPYSEWHRSLGRQYYSSDIDSIEWRIIDGELKAVAIMEITRVDNHLTVSRKYLDAILDRFFSRDLQSKTALKISEALNVKAYIILFRQDCSEFWLFNLTDKLGWYYLKRDKMEQFIKGLK